MSRKRKIEKPVLEPVAISAGPRLTCEGCQALRRYPTPMCRDERSPNFRLPVDTYHTACGRYTTQGVRPAEQPKPEPPAPPRHELVGHADRDKRLKHNRWAIRDGVLFKPRDPEHAALMERNRARKVRA